jgi:hypothetical protein
MEVNKFKLHRVVIGNIDLSVLGIKSIKETTTIKYLLYRFENILEEQNFKTAKEIQTSMTTFIKNLYEGYSSYERVLESQQEKICRLVLQFLKSNQKLFESITVQERKIITKGQILKQMSDQRIYL